MLDRAPTDPSSKSLLAQHHLEKLIERLRGEQRAGEIPDCTILARKLYSEAGWLANSPPRGLPRENTGMMPKNTPVTQDSKYFLAKHHLEKLIDRLRREQRRGKIPDCTILARKLYGEAGWLANSPPRGLPKENI